MIHMACFSSMSHLEARLRKDTTLGFNWMLVLFLLVVSSTEASPVLKLVNSTVGGTSRFTLCSTDESQNIKSVTWGEGSSPTDESLLLERNHDDNDVDSSQRRSVDENYYLIIKNTTMKDAGPYWCQVTPKDKLSYPCSFTLIVRENEPEAMETTPTITMPNPKEGTMAGYRSKAVPTVVSLSASVFIALLSGMITVWLTNVAGVG